MSTPKLTAKQAAFVDAYLIDLNATAAAVRAGYSSRRADAIGWENLRKPEIQTALRERLEARRQRVQVEADQVITMLLTEARRRGEGASHSARVRACELLGRHLGLFVDRHEVTGDGVFEIRLVRESADGSVRALTDYTDVADWPTPALPEPAGHGRNASWLM